MSLAILIAEARANAGDPMPCLTGAVPHDWISDHAGRCCPNSPDDGCSMTVYVCRRCGDYDYGEPGGPGDEECRTFCKRRSMFDSGSQVPK